jgi:hypothetical protein
VRGRSPVQAKSSDAATATGIRDVRAAFAPVADQDRSSEFTSTTENHKSRRLRWD